MDRSISRLMAIGLAFTSVACVQVYGPPSPAAQPAAGTPPAASGSSGARASTDSSKSQDSTKTPFKKWDDVLKDTRAISGYLTTHLKRDNTLYLEIAPEQLDKDFGLIMHYSRGVGVFNMHDGLPLSETRVMRLTRVGDRIHLVHMNTRFTASPGSPMRVSLDDNVGHSVVAAFKIESEHSDTKHLLLNITPFIVSDYASLTRQLRFYYGVQPIRLDSDRSYVAGVQGFPRNVEIDARMTLRASGFPRSGGQAIPDYRSVPVGVRYSIFALPEEPMRPRLADDRVGFFLGAVKDFSRDQQSDPYVRFVNRWRLEKSDHSRPVADAVEPIVYYVDRSVPLEYREYVKEGIEAWNKAFEAAGISHAIVAKDAPDDSTWSAEDIRYSTVRWTAAHQMGYAIGPSQTDPRTGEILNADVLISSTFVRSWLHEYQEIAGPDELRERIEQMNITARNDLPPHLMGRFCFAEIGKAHQLGLQYTVLAGLGEIEPGAPLPEDYLGDAVRDLVMHEVGHTLGMRHNFKGSWAVPTSRLHDTTFTRKNGVTLSVMEYGAVNIAAERSMQGDYWNKQVGSYDLWTIRYGYAPVYQQSASGEFAVTGIPVATSDAELVGLRKIAAESTNPLHAYGTDEDARLGPYSLDPRSSTWDLGSDQMAFARERIALVNQVLPQIEQRLIGSGEGYQRLRGAMTGMFFERLLALLPVTKYVGGLYVSRAHKGDPNAELPFTPIPASKQREAVQFLIDNAFGENAFQLDAELLNKLAPTRWADWGSPFFVIPLDYPVHDYVSLIHEVALYDVMDGNRLARMMDNEVRMTDGEAYRVSDLFGTLTDAIMAEAGIGGGVARSAHSFRRNLQRLYLNELSGVLNATNPSLPGDARSLARYELKRISTQLETALASASIDTVTRAHFDEAKELIDRMLDAPFVRTIR